MTLNIHNFFYVYTLDGLWSNVTAHLRHKMVLFRFLKKNVRAFDFEKVIVELKIIPLSGPSRSAFQIYFEKNFSKSKYFNFKNTSQKCQNIYFDMKVYAYWNDIFHFLRILKLTFARYWLFKVKVKIKNITTVKKN